MNKTILTQWSRMGPRAMFGQFMIDLAKKNMDLMVISADLGRSSGLDRFKEAFPKQYLSVGICEQNLIGIASGLAREGYKVFVTSFAPFLSMRASEHIRMNLGYMKHPVNVVALGSGLSMGFLGNSHFGLEDIGIMRTIPGLKIFSPADSLELKKILFDLSSNKRGPSYVRLTGIPGSPIVYEKDYKYKFKTPNIINNGKDCLIFSSGSVIGQVKIACDLLKRSNINPCIINIHTLKPLNTSFIKKYINNFKYIVTIEEHTIVGGLNSLLTQSFVSELNHNKKILNISLPDEFGPTGDYEFLLDYHGLSGKKIFKKIKNFLKN